MTNYGLITDGLVACWKASDWSSGTTWTDSIAGKTITFSGTPSTDTDGIGCTTSVTFTSESLSSLGVTAPFTFEWLGRVDGTFSSSAPGNLFNLGTANDTWGSSNINCYLHSTRGVALDCTGSGNIQSSITTTGITYHVVITGNASGTITLYVNSNASVGYGSYSTTASASKNYISNGEGSGRFNGAINRISLWNKVLDSDEITTLFEEAVNKYTVTSAITGGTITSENPATITEGLSSTITFTKTDDSYVLKSMTINGASVTPTLIDEHTESGNTPTISISTNTSEYTTDSNGIESLIDNDTSTYYWTNSALSVGNYIMLTLTNAVYLKSVTVSTSSTTDGCKSNCQLQISTDNSNWTTVGTFADSTDTSQTISSINQNAQYVRLYIASAATSWWKLTEISLDYDIINVTIPAYYTYTINSISENLDVIIVFGASGPLLYVKLNDTTWKAVKNIYLKDSSGWALITSTTFNNLASGNKFIQKEVPAYAIGDVTSSTNAINITEETLSSDTYTLYYEDADGNKLTDWDAIGTITKS